MLTVNILLAIPSNSSNTSAMKAGFLQFSPKYADPIYNLETVTQMIKEINADLLVLPELALSGYYFTDKKKLTHTAKIIRDKCLPELAKLCALKNTALVIGYPEISGTSLFNSAMLITPRREMFTYRKMHLFNTEKDIFDTSEQGFQVIEYNGIKLGMLVCFDHFYPEAARSLALKGVQIICHPSNLVLPEKGQLTTRVRAIENGVFWILANRTGSENNNGKTVRFTGCSQIIAPDGDVLTAADDEELGCGIVEINPADADNKAVTDKNELFSDRRIEFYE